MTGPPLPIITRPRHLLAMLGISLSLVIAPALAAIAADTKGVQVVTRQGRELLRYGASHALLIGVSDYGWRSGWHDLDAVPGELDRVGEALKAVGFQEIVRVDDPDEDRLRDAFEDFKDKYGFDRNNRLLFFFSGHGYTDSDGAGYLVPSDAPDPRKDRQGFFSKALPMSQILAWAKQIKARHALFLFDSCFSGSVFRERSLPKEPPHITKLTARRVRQFITAGSANEPVPARSTFTPVFADAILHGKGDLNGDGYVTGMELGVHLEAEVPKYVAQTPQFGKIDEYDLAQGDFVFVLEKPDPVLRDASGGRGQTSGGWGPAPLARAPSDTVDPVELKFWDSVEKSDDPDLYRAYLKQYPKGSFAALARIKLRKLASSSRQGMPGPSARDGENKAMPGPSARDGNTPMPGPSARDGENKGMPGPSARDGKKKPPDPPPAPTTGKLIVRSNVSGDRVFIDGKAMGATGPAAHILSPGEHEIRVEKEGFKTFKAKIHLVAGGEETVRARLEREVPSHDQGFRDRLRDGSQGPEMVSIRGGCFQMGSPDSEKGRDDNERRHRVCVEGFGLGKTEVTFAEYDRFARATRRKQPSDSGWGRGKRPVINVSWKDATAYAEWLSGQTGKEYRLPTEAEWEYAARAGTSSRYYWGTNEKSACAYANFCDTNCEFPWASSFCSDGYKNTAPVGSFRPNGFGLFDMSGNVWEWTCSLYKENYDGSEKRCTSKGGDGRRALRGGSWSSIPGRLRSSYRFRFNPNGAGNGTGFRLARDF